MTLIPGSVRVGGKIAPSDSTDTYGSHEDIYGIGGHRSVSDLTARDAITTERRKEGMSVFVVAEGKNYQLIGGITNSDWVESASTYVDPGYTSSGVYTMPPYLDNLDGSVQIGSGEYILAKNADGSGAKEKYTVLGNTFILNDGAVNYLVVNYNAGTPILQNISDVTLINETTIIPVYTIFRTGTILHLQNWDSLGKSLANKVHQSIVKTQRYRRESGLAIAEVGTRNISLSSGRVWVGAVPVNLTSINTSITDNIAFYYHVAGVWTLGLVTQFNNSQYDNGTNLVALTPNRYTVNWIFRGVEYQNHLYMVLGTGDYTLAQAEAALVPALPVAISSHSTLVGKIIVQQGAASATSVQSAFDVQFSYATPVEHNDLLGIQGGAIAERYHLDATQYAGTLFNNLGRFGGTILIGGTGAAESLELKGTSNPTTGPVFTNDNFLAKGRSAFGNNSVIEVGKVRVLKNIVSSSTISGVTDIYGDLIDISNTPGSTSGKNFYGNTIAVTVESDAVGNHAYLYGSSIVAAFYGQANLTNLINIASTPANIASSPSSTITNLFGLHSHPIHSSAGNTTNFEALKTEVDNFGSGTVTNARALHCATPRNLGGGTMAHYHHLYLEDPGSASADSWAIYSLGSTSRSYFAGSIGIGKTNITGAGNLGVNGRSAFGSTCTLNPDLLGSFTTRTVRALKETYTSTVVGEAAAMVGDSVDLLFQAGSNTGKDFYGRATTVDIASSSTGALRYLYGHLYGIAYSGQGDLDSALGIELSIVNQASDPGAVLTDMIGVTTHLYHTSASTTNNATGQIVQIDNYGAGDINTARGTLYRAPVIGGSGVINSYAHIYLEDPGVGHSIYSTGSTSLNYFQGRVGINAVNPSAKMDIIVSNTNNVPALEINQNDVTNNPKAVIIDNTGTGDSLEIRNSGTPVFNVRENGDLLSTGKTLIPLLNQSGGALSAGDVVIVSTAVDESCTTTTTAADIQVLGVVRVGGGNGTTVYLTRCGIVDINVTGTIARGDFLASSTSAGYAESTGTSGAPGDFAIALQAQASGTGTIKALLKVAEVY